MMGVFGENVSSGIIPGVLVLSLIQCFSVNAYRKSMYFGCLDQFNRQLDTVAPPLVTTVQNLAQNASQRQNGRPRIYDILASLLHSGK